MEILGIKFAPLNVPLKRRLETLSVAILVVWFGGGNLWGFLITGYLLFYTTTIRYFMLLYFLWMYYDWDTHEKGGRGEIWTRWLRNCAWLRYCADYFPVKLVKTADLDPTKKYLLCFFPHGVIPFGIFGCFGTDSRGSREMFPGLDIRPVTLTQQFKIPLFREYVYLNGAISSSLKSLNYHLSTKPKPPFTGSATVLVVGGASEALECRTGIYRLLAKRRKGFVKIALQNGASLVPVFSFGETDVYDQVYGAEGTRLKKIQHLIRSYIGIPPVLLKGRGFFQYSFGIIAQRKPITVVVGSPIDVPKVPEPTQEQIDEYHAKFVDSLVELFETHKHKYVENADSAHIELV